MIRELDRDQAAVMLVNLGLQWLRETPTATVHAFRIWLVDRAQESRCNIPSQREWTDTLTITAKRIAEKIYAIHRDLRPDHLPVDDREF